MLVWGMCLPRSTKITNKVIYRKQNEMRESRAESDRKTEEFHKRMAEISYRQGRLAEDLVAPIIPDIMAQVVGCLQAPDMIAISIYTRISDGRSQSYDVVAICGDYLLINETR